MKNLSHDSAKRVLTNVKALMTETDDWAIKEEVGSISNDSTTHQFLIKILGEFEQQK